MSRKKQPDPVSRRPRFTSEALDAPLTEAGPLAGPSEPLSRALKQARPRRHHISCG